MKMKHSQTETEKQLRDEISRAINEGATARGLAGLRDYWGYCPAPSTAGWVARSLSQLKMRSDRKVKCAVCRSFTVEPILQQCCQVIPLWGLELEVHLGGFDAYVEAILNPQSALYQFAPDVMILAVSTHGLCPDLWEGFVELSTAKVEKRLEEIIGLWKNLLFTFRKHSSAVVLVHNLELPPELAWGLADVRLQWGQGNVFRRLNVELAEIALSLESVYILDIAHEASVVGRREWLDHQRWVGMGLPYGSQAVTVMTQLWIRSLVATFGKQIKLVVIDLDNTLWRGVLGELGIEGLQVENKVSHTQKLQRSLLNLKVSGVLLAICSKNNEQDVLVAFEQLDFLKVRLSDFVAVRINWEDKASNIRNMVETLNIGLDSVLFIDDSEYECEWVQTQLKGVEVVHFPTESAMSCVERLRGHPRLARLTVSAEDRVRVSHYTDQVNRERLRETSDTLENFWRSLEMELYLPRLDETVIERIAQLTQKTNQFNLTTRRYNSAEIRKRVESPDWDVIAYGLRDRFGDQGIVGVAMGEFVGSSYRVDTFLMSCRVIGRTVESMMMAVLCGKVEKRGIDRVSLEYIPSEKNQPALAYFEKFRSVIIGLDGSNSKSSKEILIFDYLQVSEWIVLSEESRVKK